MPIAWVARVAHPDIEYIPGFDAVVCHTGDDVVRSVIPSDLVYYYFLIFTYFCFMYIVGDKIRKFN